MAAVTQRDVMKALAEHAKTLGWEIAEWSWKDDDAGGYSEYQLWLHPLDDAEEDDRG